MSPRPATFNLFRCSWVSLQARSICSMRDFKRDSSRRRACVRVSVAEGQELEFPAKSVVAGQAKLVDDVFDFNQVISRLAISSPAPAGRARRRRSPPSAEPEQPDHEAECLG